MTSRRALASSALALTLAALPGGVHAGDACPIEISLYDLGTPADVDRAALLASLETQRTWFGLTYDNRDGAAVVTIVHGGSPAEAAGVRVGDRITHVNFDATADRAAVNAVFDAAPEGAGVLLSLLRGEETLDLGLAPGPRDPLQAALAAHFADDECLDGSLATVDPAWRVDALTRVFADGKLRCKDAHKALAKDDFLSSSGGDLVMFRTAGQVLVSMPGYATTCVKASDVDGAKLTPKAVARLFGKVGGRYVKSRMDNP